MSAAGYTPEEPIAAIATALAPAALGIVRCSGKGVVELLAPLFSRPKALLEAAGNTLVYGWLVEPDLESAPSEKAGQRIDEVLVAVFRCDETVQYSILAPKRQWMRKSQEVRETILLPQRRFFLNLLRL